MAAYGPDLAFIHDTGYGDFAHGIAPGLLALMRRANITSGRVVDLGCGSGIWAKHLVDNGYDVIGVDISPAMIDIARHRVPSAKFHVASLVEFEIPRCRVVTALGEVFSYLFDAPESRQPLPNIFNRVYAALESGGLFVFDVAEVGLHRETPPTFREGDDWACLVGFEYDDERQQLARQIVTFRRDGELYRRSQESHRQQLYREHDVCHMLNATGFEVTSTRHFGDFPLLPLRIGFIARKR